MLKAQTSPALVLPSLSLCLLASGCLFVSSTSFLLSSLCCFILLVSSSSYTCSPSRRCCIISLSLLPFQKKNAGSTRIRRPPSKLKQSTSFQTPVESNFSNTSVHFSRQSYLLNHSVDTHHRSRVAQLHQLQLQSPYCLVHSFIGRQYQYENPERHPSLNLKHGFTSFYF
jgi:hypothetical protein